MKIVLLLTALFILASAENATDLTAYYNASANYACGSSGTSEL